MVHVGLGRGWEHLPLHVLYMGILYCDFDCFIAGEENKREKKRKIHES